MILTEEIGTILSRLMNTAVKRSLGSDDFKDICSALKVAKMYYDVYLGENDRYRNMRTKKLVISGDEQDGMMILYDSGKKTGIRRTYTYYYDNVEFAHAYIEFDEGVREDELDLELYQMMADIMYILVDTQNMRKMLDFAEVVDAQTGIPNVVFIRNKYEMVKKRIPSEDIFVLYINLQNFKYINEAGGAKAGDEAIISYARRLLEFIEDDESVCRMGGDNFSMFIKKENLDKVLEKLRSVTIGHLQSVPNRTFDVSAWIGISEGKPDDRRPFVARLEEASIACNLGKSRLKRNVVVFADDLAKMLSRGREILAMFHPAVQNHEFHPFFQAKVDMHTGDLIGFEALCRWIHDGRFIYPDQFIPVLDKEGLIHELDMAIFNATCAAIRKWKDMGLEPPRISSNFSRKNLFVPQIEEKILSVIQQNGISVENVEIEITESIKEFETGRLIEFVKKLKEYGLHISVDDFGTGYSSLSLIHSIDADVIKIDKSFVDEIPGDRKSEILIESIIGIARNLDMMVIAEGIETKEQGKTLMELGCPNAQGYYYSKPVDFETATKIIAERPFKPISE